MNSTMTGKSATNQLINIPFFNKVAEFMKFLTIKCYLKYFPDDIKHCNWIKEPFTEKPLSNFTAIFRLILYYE